jgi:hypothetical protein
MLDEEVKLALCSEHGGVLTNRIVVQHEYVKPHIAAVTTETIQKLKFELLPHPAYSPHLAPSHYGIFRLLRDVLCGHQFANNEEVTDTVHIWLHMQPKTFFTDGISKSVGQSNKCLEKLGDYVEK